MSRLQFVLVLLVLIIGFVDCSKLKNNYTLEDSIRVFEKCVPGEKISEENNFVFLKYKNVIRVVDRGRQHIYSSVSMNSDIVDTFLFDNYGETDNKNSYIFVLLRHENSLNLGFILCDVATKNGKDLRIVNDDIITYKANVGSETIDDFLDKNVEIEVLSGNTLSYLSQNSIPDKQINDEKCFPVYVRTNFGTWVYLLSDEGELLSDNLLTNDCFTFSSSHNFISFDDGVFYAKKGDRLEEKLDMGVIDKDVLVSAFLDKLVGNYYGDPAGYYVYNKHNLFKIDTIRGCYDCEEIPLKEDILDASFCQSVFVTANGLEKIQVDRKKKIIYKHPSTFIDYIIQGENNRYGTGFFFDKERGKVILVKTSVKHTFDDIAEGENLTTKIIDIGDSTELYDVDLFPGLTKDIVILYTSIGVLEFMIEK